MLRMDEHFWLHSKMQGNTENVRFTRTDVSVEDDVAAMTDLAIESFGRLDIVFNNAGIGGAFRTYY